MPFKSKAQRRFFYSAESRGDLPKGTAEKWEEHTPKGKKLPDHVKEAFWAGFVKAAQGETYLFPEGQTDTERGLSVNDRGGINPRDENEAGISQAVDLLTLPMEASGASCGNCMHYKTLNPAVGNGVCTNPQVGLEVTTRMHCSLWDAHGVMRGWEDPSAEMPGMMPAGPEGLPMEEGVEDTEAYNQEPDKKTRAL